MAECLCSVLCVKPYSGYYPGCPKCMRKLTEVKNEVHKDQHTNRVFCRSCVKCYSFGDIYWNYCVAMTVTDGIVVSEVVTFGNRLNLLFGWTAQELHGYLLDRFCLPYDALPLQNPIISDYLIQAITTVMTGKVYRFHFKWRPAHHCGNGSSSILQSICKGVQGGTDGGCVTASCIEEIHSTAGQGEVGGARTVAMVLKNMLIVKENLLPNLPPNLPPCHQETFCLSRPQIEAHPQHIELSCGHYTGNSFYDQFNDDTNLTSSTLTTPLRLDTTTETHEPNQHTTSTFNDNSGWTESSQCCCTQEEDIEGYSRRTSGPKDELPTDDEFTWNVTGSSKLIRESSSLANNSNTETAFVNDLIARNSPLCDDLITRNSTLINELFTGNYSSFVNKIGTENDSPAVGESTVKWNTSAASCLVSTEPVTAIDGLSFLDYKHLIDEIKDDWLLTQPGFHSLPHRNQTSHRNQTLLQHENQPSVQLDNQQSYLSPFWNAFSSFKTTSTVSPNNSTDKCTNDIDLPPHVPANDTQPVVTTTSSLFITPKLKRKVNKRHVLLPKPQQHTYTGHDYNITPSFQPIASSTPSVSMATSHQLIDNNTTNVGYMSPDIL